VTSDASVSPPSSWPGAAASPVTFVTRLVRHGVIEPEEAGFRPEVALLVLRVVRLRRDLGVNTQGAAVIVDLLRRIDDLERRLRHRGQA
jgi:hypothetical protein